MLLTNESRAIKGVDSSNNEVTDIDIINVNSTRSVKVKQAMLKNLIYSKKSEIGIFTSKARLAFTKLRQVFIKT